MNINELINNGSIELKKNNIRSYLLDSEILLSRVLRKKREELLISLQQDVDKKSIIKFKELVNRRSSKEPIAYILKDKEFWSKSFEVNKHTLIPRPETELMIEKLVQIYKKKTISILDIGTGSGCILISLLSELKKARGIGVDISREAISVAKKNAKRHKINFNSQFFTKPFQSIYNKKFDLIVSNPPYIKSRVVKALDDDIKKYEPHLALDGGNDGLDVIKKVIYKAREILRLNGLLSLEIGNGQYQKVSEILKKNNFRTKHIVKDYKDNRRCLISNLLKWLKHEQQ